MAESLTDQDFKARVLDAPGLVLVDFGAEWCPPCRALEPIMADLAKELGGRVTIYAMDADHNPDTAARYDVRGLPTVILFKNGEPVDRLYGLRPKQAYVSAITKSA